MKRIAALIVVVCSLGSGQHPRMRPVVDTKSWQVAGNPALGAYTGERQQPVDFAIWQARDGTWQLWSCVRGTKCGGNTRLFFRWEGKELTQADWQPRGIAMQADPSLGETPGGLQAPHVVRDGDSFHMLYGDWEHICHATSRDGKLFERVTQPSGHTGMFGEGAGFNTRDPMLLHVAARTEPAEAGFAATASGFIPAGPWYCYYTAFPDQHGAVFCRTSPDLRTWSNAYRVAYSGAAGTSPYSAECPYVVFRAGAYYLFRTQRYGRDAMTRVYRSEDPLQFGIDEDAKYLVAELPIAAPEVVRWRGEDYISYLNPGLDGIRISRLRWESVPSTSTAPIARASGPSPGTQRSTATSTHP